jgi:hypothetical protein
VRENGTAIVCDVLPRGRRFRGSEECLAEHDVMESRSPPNPHERGSGVAVPPTAETLAAVEHDTYDALAVIIARSQLLSRRLTRGTAEPGDVVEGLAVIERAARRILLGVERLAGGPGSVPSDGRQTAPERASDAPRPASS